MITGKLDSKGRVLIPKEAREELGLRAGDTLFFEWNSNQLRVARATNPFEALAINAVDEYRAGETTSIEDFARELGIDLESDE